MSEPTYQVYDFAASARVDRPLSLALRRWLDKYAERFVEQYANFSSTEIDAEALLVDAESFESLQNKWDDPAFCAEIQFQDNEFSGMLVATRVEMIKLLMDILGNTVEGETEDRELTSVEYSLCEMVFEQAASTLAESWPEQEPLIQHLQPLDLEPAHSRLFPPDQMLLKSGLLLKLPGTSVSLQLLLPKAEAAKLLNVTTRAPAARNPASRLDPNQIAQINVEVSAGLGSTDLPMTELAAMSIGDIIVLDQSIEKPLTLFANDEPAFEAWPGRCEQHQAMQITSSLV